MNTTLVAIALVHLASAAEWSRVGVGLVSILGILCVAAEGLFRVVNGSHWASDLPGSVLLAFAWMRAAPAFVVLGPGVLAGIVMLSVTAYATFHVRPAFPDRAPVPSRTGSRSRGPC